MSIETCQHYIAIYRDLCYSFIYFSLFILCPRFWNFHLLMVLLVWLFFLGVFYIYKFIELYAVIAIDILYVWKTRLIVLNTCNFGDNDLSIETNKQPLSENKNKKMKIKPFPMSIDRRLPLTVLLAQ